MSVVSLVTLLVNVACALVHVAWGVDDAVALAHVDVEVQVMGMDAGAIAPVEDDLLLHVAAACHLDVVAVTAGHPHIAILVVVHLMLMGTKAVTSTEANV